jgi:hypothetical protein
VRTYQWFTVELVPFPIGGVVTDVIRDAFVFGDIADDAFEIPTLPDQRSAWYQPIAHGLSCPRFGDRGRP